MGILDIFKKKKKEEVYDSAPNLMAADPASGGTVDLMASDPINTVMEAPIMEQAPEIVEQPGIEDQLVRENPVTYEATNSVSAQEPAPALEPNPSIDAFAMPAPEASEPIIETPENLDSANNVSNKFCSECGTPNDALSKFCVSCGKALE